MGIYERFSPFLFQMDEEKAHNLAMRMLRIAGRSPVAGILEWSNRVRGAGLSQNLMGIDFPNPVGLAAGWDKYGRIARGLQMMGFGFIELGSITLLPQDIREEKRLHRFVDQGVLINRMRFNNPGAYTFAKDLSCDKPHIKIPVGVSLGKGAYTKGLDKILLEYSEMIDLIYVLADYIVLNISSPNTQGLRDLIYELETILTFVRAKIREQATLYGEMPKPLVVKLSPDMTRDQLDGVLGVCAAFDNVHFIATNTTLSREGLDDIAGGYPEGGASGHKVLFEKALATVRIIRDAFPRRVIIHSGGIDSAYAGCMAMINEGADLVQLFTHFVLPPGPRLIREINETLLEKQRAARVGTIHELR